MGCEQVTVDAREGTDTVVIDGAWGTVLGGTGDDVFIVNAVDPRGLRLDGGEGSDGYIVNLGAEGGTASLYSTHVTRTDALFGARDTTAGIGGRTAPSSTRTG